MIRGLVIAAAAAAAAAKPAKKAINIVIATQKTRFPAKKESKQLLRQLLTMPAKQMPAAIPLLLLN